MTCLEQTKALNCSLYYNSSSPHTQNKWNNSGVIANIGLLNASSLGLAIIVGCWYGMNDESMFIEPSFILLSLRLLQIGFYWRKE